MFDAARQAELIQLAKGQPIQTTLLFGAEDVTVTVSAKPEYDFESIDVLTRQQVQDAETQEPEATIRSRNAFISEKIAIRKSDKAKAEAHRLKATRSSKRR